MVVFDAAFLLMLLDPQITNPKDAITGLEVNDFRQRIDFLIADLQKKREKILIPTPALSEVLVRADKARADYAAKLSKSAEFRIEPFCPIAALEVAIMCKEAIDAGDKKAGSKETWTKIKYDRQIIAIARVHQAISIYTNDENLIKFSKARGLNAFTLSSLPLPPQSSLELVGIHEAQETSKAANN